MPIIKTVTVMFCLLSISLLIFAIILRLQPVALTALVRGVDTKRNKFQTLLAHICLRERIKLFISWAK